ncbi:MAG: hypothetical protein AB7F89_00965 [Pirellulaceae bacterium]
MNALLVSTILCDRCHAEISAQVRQCPHCGAAQTVATLSGNTATPAAAPHSEYRERLIDKPWLLTVVLLHVGLLGIPLYWTTRYSLGVRLGICLASVVYTIAAVAGIGWGLWYIYSQLA